MKHEACNKAKSVLLYRMNKKIEIESGAFVLYRELLSGCCVIEAAAVNLLMKLFGWISQMGLKRDKSANNEVNEEFSSFHV